MRNSGKSIELLTRDEFRSKVFERDGHKCVICKKPAADAHHIMERRLWPDGGYYVDNGASVCAECHIRCETTELSVEQVREAAGVRKIVPPHLYDDQVYDKWGNPILADGTRQRGELFDDESVRKILAVAKVQFTKYVKYPRTYHVPWSPGATEDDRVLESMKIFENKWVVVTDKMDGENTSMYSDHIHARSLDSAHHESRTWVKNFWSQIRADIPHGWRVCGENLFAKHSIHYTSLLSYFLGFSVWDDMNRCLPWNETLEWFHLLGIKHVPCIYVGKYDEDFLRHINIGDSEGYVIRNYEGFRYGDFRHNVAKYVRKGHVQTSHNWMRQAVQKNGLA